MKYKTLRLKFTNIPLNSLASSWFRIFSEKNA